MPISLTLRLAVETDLLTLFEHQAHPEAIQMAAFVADDPYDWTAYRQKWERLLKDPAVHFQVILYDGVLVGSIAKYEQDGAAELTYAIAPTYWGQGIGSIGVQQFLQLESMRPMGARVAFDNIGSQRVLEKNGFKRVGLEQGFAAGRGKVIEEFVYVLE